VKRPPMILVPAELGRAELVECSRKSAECVESPTSDTIVCGISWSIFYTRSVKGSARHRIADAEDCRCVEEVGPTDGALEATR